MTELRNFSIQVLIIWYMYLRLIEFSEICFFLENAYLLVVSLLLPGIYIYLSKKKENNVFLTDLSFCPRILE